MSGSMRNAVVHHIETIRLKVRWRARGAKCCVLQKKRGVSGREGRCCPTAGAVMLAYARVCSEVHSVIWGMQLQIASRVV